MSPILKKTHRRTYVLLGGLMVGFLISVPYFINLNWRTIPHRWIDEGIWNGVRMYGSGILSLGSVAHRFSDSVLELRDSRWSRELLVSGPYSFLPILCFVVAWSIWRGKTWFVSFLYIAIGCFWSLAATVAQTATKVLFKSKFDLDLANGIGSHAVGLAAVLVVVLLMLSSERMVSVVFYPITNDRFEFDHRNPLLNVWNKVFRVLEFSKKRTSNEVA